LRGRVRSALLGGQMLDSGLFNPKAIRQIVDQHESGARDHSTPIWTLLMYDAFLRNALGEPRKAREACAA
jgi:asparagine synthase (glutamine-hydrolysing)